MANELDHVVWIGGTSCAGKTTVARLLAAALGLQVYSTDVHFDRHARDADAAAQPTMHAYQHDAPWFCRTDRTPAEAAALWRRFYAERFPRIAAELAAAGPVVAEGVDLLPDAVAAFADPARAAWLVPTRAFWEPVHYRERNYVEAALTTAAAERDWAYYADMIDHHRGRCAALGLYLVEVDSQRPAAQIAADLAARLDGRLPAAAIAANLAARLEAGAPP